MVCIFKMGIKQAKIYLDNQDNTYYAGQTVNGRVEYVFDSPKKVRGIYVIFKGEAHTGWLHLDGVTTPKWVNDKKLTYEPGYEKYFQIQQYLLGSKSGNTIEIPAGKHSYNFACALPPVLPSSLVSGDWCEWGVVLYTIRVILDRRPWKFSQETELTFTVINALALDLNLNPSCRAPIHMQLEKTFCCLCCASAPLCVDVRAPVSGYCPGQSIPLTINVVNKSFVKLRLVKIMLRKVLTYRSKIPNTIIKTNKEVVHTVQEGPVPAGSTKNWTIKLDIPPVPPSNFDNCSIIDLDYDLKVECVVSRPHKHMSDKKYVTIGTVPLVEGGKEQPAPAPPPDPDPTPESPSQSAVL